MRIALMRFVDQHIGTWLCRTLALLLCCSRTHRRRIDHPVPPAPDSVRTVVVMKFLGLGSILQATPLFQALRRRYPKARLTLVTFQSNGALADLGIGVDTLVTVDTSSVWRFLASTLAALGLLRQTCFDVAINLEFFAAYATLLTVLLRKRFSLAFGGFADYRHRLFDDFISYDSAAHVQQKFLNFARRLGYDGPSPPLVRLRVDQAVSVVEKIERRERFLLHPEDYCVLVNINSGEMAPRRRWPAAYFHCVVENLLLRSRVRCLLIGGAQDRAAVAQFHASLSRPSRVVNLAGRTSLRELVALMQRADLYLGNDSGPLHLAVCAGLPVLALFGPESPAVYGPPASARHTIFYRSEPCSPCLNIYTDKRSRCRDNICLKRIQPQQVLEVLEERYLPRSSAASASRWSLPLVSDPRSVCGVP